MTRESAAAAERCLKLDGPRVVARIVEFSETGRAPKNDPALFVLAMALKTGDEPTRKAAEAAVPRVARIGTHLFRLAQFVEAFGGWGRRTRRAFREWYRNQTSDDLALQAIKYQSRDGWGHRDILRLAHPRAPSFAHQLVYRFMAGLEAAQVSVIPQTPPAPRKGRAAKLLDEQVGHQPRKSAVSVRKRVDVNKAVMKADSNLVGRV